MLSIVSTISINSHLLFYSFLHVIQPDSVFIFVIYIYIIYYINIIIVTILSRIRINMVISILVFECIWECKMKIWN